jgi:putative endonuclease
VKELVKQQPELKKRKLSAHQCSQHNFSLGAAGESRAVKYLTSLDYRIITQNVRLKNAEIDLIAFDVQSNEMVFIEVKTRSTEKFGNPSQAVTRKKLHNLQKVARKYCKEHRVTLDYRFDTIAVLPESIEHFQNISWGMS